MKDLSQLIMIDGTLYVVKVTCTVWVRGKGGDNIKTLPIDIEMLNIMIAIDCI